MNKKYGLLIIGLGLISSLLVMSVYRYGFAIGRTAATSIETEELESPKDQQPLDI